MSANGGTMKIYALNTFKRRGTTAVLAIVLIFLIANVFLPSVRSMCRTGTLTPKF